MTKRESAAINKSLLALKECLRAIGGANGGGKRGVKGAPTKPPFRNSNLTRLLEDALLPGPTSSRHNLESHSVMLVCAGPGDKHERMTVNALRYGQMMAKGATGTKGVKGQKGAKRVGSRAGAGGGSTFISGAGKRPEKPWLTKTRNQEDDQRGGGGDGGEGREGGGGGGGGGDDSRGWQGRGAGGSVKATQL